VLSHILHTIHDWRLLVSGDHVLVAVSGGPDSTALLHGLVKLAPRLGITLTVACVDHGLRPESADEARVVRQRCEGWSVSCEILKVDVGKRRRSHVSLQEAAREARFAALEGAADRLGCTKIALGHTADDQAETVLFRIIRGTGIAGLAGIPYQRGPFIRPLLDVRRSQLLTYLSKRKLGFFEDPSNANRRYARSRIRYDVLPALSRENPRVAEALLALAAEAQKGDARVWRKNLPSDLYLPIRTVKTVDRLVREGQGTRLVDVRNGTLVVHYGKVTWQSKSDPGRGNVKSFETAMRPIHGPGTYRVGDPQALAITLLPTCNGAYPGGNTACFDVKKVKWPLSLRTPQSGDRMTPRLGRGSRKLSDLFIDAKIARLDRSTFPVLCDATGTILFVPGLRPSEAGRPDNDTREWFEVHVAR
jgi:tRNA(Ile)-lysidine synthase